MGKGPKHKEILIFEDKFASVYLVGSRNTKIQLIQYKTVYRIQNIPDDYLHALWSFPINHSILKLSVYFDCEIPQLHYYHMSHKPLSHRDSGKYTDDVTRHLSRDCLISVHSHCQ